LNLKERLKAAIPQRALGFFLRTRRRITRARVASLPALTESELNRILLNDLGITEGDTVFVHSSADQLNLSFPFARMLLILQGIVGERGTLLFPTYPRLKSYEFLSRGLVFDVRKTASSTGLLTEIARRHPNAWRSLHPTKSVCAIGRHARELVSTHQDSPYPYDKCSPYYQIMKYSGKVIGIGAMTKKLAFAHCVEDALREQFPVKIYHEHLFSARCINSNGQEEVVRTYAHDISKMNHNTSRFVKRHISADICEDLTIRGMPFFRTDAKKLFDVMMELAKAGVTIYPRSSYSKSLLASCHGTAKICGGA
jgi:aminoglycoside 3-N-acetyltransferase